MKTVFEHVEHIKGKPHHIRKRVAFSAAAFGAAFIALVWLAGSLGTGAFAIKGSSFADAANQGGTITTTSDTAATSQLAGVGAAAVLNQSADVPAHIEIVDTTPTAPKKTEQTTIPF